ncbi:MAG TPA: FAD binding domain-containing protein [Anaerolineales bacterium]|nr:FAD binding domain-containing protein [Anaerolineales bacterium]HNQ93188.1 FAD binding domain-containing protein [Anaerolineales bacterium]HNS60371.1 FAD binding domain-containing protein [Anaerolineales bacterium]
MITAYHRPKTLDEALALLSQPNTVPLGGGTLLSQPTTDSVHAVDLQLLGLNSLRVNGNNLELGATLTLQSLLESEHCPDALKRALKLEAPLNIRNSATLAGTLVSCDGRSTFGTVLLAMDAKIAVMSKQSAVSSNQSSAISVGEFLPLRPRGLITSISIPLNVKLAFEYVSRTPSDKPIVCVALAQWNSGRTRLAVGGFGKSPMLAMDGTASDDAATAARNAFHEANDDYGSAEYRMDVASTLAKRCMEAQ